MKRLPLLAFTAGMLLAGEVRVTAQDNLTYGHLLGTVNEIVLEDSVNFEKASADTTSIDSMVVKKFFAQILSNGANKFKNKSYSLLGKITSNNNFDLLLLLEDKKKNDTSGIQVLYLVSMKKTGDYIASIKAAVNGTKKRTAYNIKSCLYKGNKIVQDSRITTNEQMYDDMTYYKISSSGRFIIDSNN